MADEKTDAVAVVEVSSVPVLEAQERAQLDVQINTAKAYPRMVSRAKDSVLTLATCDKETAEACFYSLPRQGKAIEGPSVRLAEIVAASYQNLRCAARIISVDDSFVTAQGAAHDLENNIAMTVEVKRRITTKHGKRYGDDMIVTTSNAACAIALRNAIFKVVPAAIFREEFKKIRECADGDAKSLRENRTNLVKYYKDAFGVDEARILAAVSKSGLDDVTMADLRVLRGIATALKDNETTVAEAFPPPEKPDILKAGKHSKKKAPKPKTETPLVPNFDKNAAIEEIKAALEDADISEQIESALASVGVSETDDWTAIGDARLEALLSKIRDIVAAKE